MPDSIKNLGSNCFKNTGLENLYIYETSKKILSINMTLKELE